MENQTATVFNYDEQGLVFKRSLRVEAAILHLLEACRDEIVSGVSNSAVMEMEIRDAARCVYLTLTPIDELDTLRAMARHLSFRHRGVYSTQDIATWTQYRNATGWDIRCSNCRGCGYVFGDDGNGKTTCPACKGDRYRKPGYQYIYKGGKFVEAQPFSPK